MAKPSLRDMSVKGRTKAEEPAQDVSAPREPETTEKEQDLKAMSLRVPPALWRDLQLRKLDENRPVNAIIIEAIQQYLRRAGGRSS